MKKTVNANIVAVKRGGAVAACAAWNDPANYPRGVEDVSTIACVCRDTSVLDAVRTIEHDLAGMARAKGWDDCIAFVDRSAAPKSRILDLGVPGAPVTVVEGVVSADGLEENSPDPQKIRARAARLACEAELDKIMPAPENTAKKPMTVIVTAGPTNERIDAVMKITNMSTGYLGKIVTETMLNADGKHARCAEQIGKIYYISPKLAYKPVVPDGQAYKLHLVQIESAMDLLDEISRICNREQVDVIVHSSAVGDYAAKYTARAEDLITEIVRRQNGKGLSLDEGELMDIFEHPTAALNDATKMSSYEPHMMTMMKLTPKIISRMRDLAPKALIFGFKLLENVTDEHLFNIASALRQKNRVDYVIANDLARIGHGKHPAMFIGHDNFQDQDVVKARCETKQGIADQICALAFGADPAAVSCAGPDAAPADTMTGKTYWHVVAANNMNTDVRIEGFAGDKADAWKIMAAEFKKTAAEMVPEIAVPRAEYLYMDRGFDFDDDGKRRLKLGADGAQVFDGEDMWYWNLVPMSYAAVDPDAVQAEDRADED